MAIDKKHVIFGLLGRKLDHSFSRKFFNDYFQENNYSRFSYQNFEITDISEFPSLIQKIGKENFGGMNVTIPYKQEVMAYLDDLSEDAKSIGAVNTIKINEQGKKIGYNSDFVGFANSIKPLLKNHHTSALILGTGGASKAVAYAFEKMNISYRFVSRVPQKTNIFSYEDLSEEVINQHKIIVNCTHLGTFPNECERPNIPYPYISNQHLLYDLIYNPSKTKFLEEAENRGAAFKNGLEMLKLQAFESWRIWGFGEKNKE